MLNIALPKGRLANKTLDLLARLGYNTDEVNDDNRKLVFTDEAGGIRYFLVKPSDVAIYVEYGTADIGVVGKDVLVENKPDVYELFDLGIGKCRVCVAGIIGYREDKDRPLRVATKFVNIARNYYASLDRDIEIIKLSGSIELAPIVGMSDVIVDLVETGNTIRENNMEITAEIMPISARLIANKSSYKFKNAELTALVKGLERISK